MIKKSILILTLFLCSSFSSARELLPISNFPTPFEQLKEAFENGVRPDLKDQDYAWYSGRCYWKNDTSDLPGADGKLANASLLILSKTDPLVNKSDDHGPLINVPKMAYTQILEMDRTANPPDYFDSASGKDGFLYGIWYLLRQGGFNPARFTGSGLVVRYNDKPSKKVVYEVRTYGEYFVARVDTYWLPQYCYYFKRTDY